MSSSAFEHKCSFTSTAQKNLLGISWLSAAAYTYTIWSDTEELATAASEVKTQDFPQISL